MQHNEMLQDREHSTTMQSISSTGVVYRVCTWGAYGIIKAPYWTDS